MSVMVPAIFGLVLLSEPAPNPEEPAAEQAAAVALQELNLGRSRLDKLMTAKGLLFEDLPEELQGEVGKWNAAIAARDHQSAIRALHVLTLWAEQVNVDRDFVLAKIERATKASLWFKGSLALTDDQAQGIHDRQDKIFEALAAERYPACNSAINDLFAYLRTLPPPPSTPPLEP